LLFSGDTALVDNPATGIADKKEELLPYQIRLPGFIIEQEVGLGDVIKRITYAMGIQPCQGCEERASALNRWAVFSPTTRGRT
jgi:hypothetical protein